MKIYNDEDVKFFEGLTLGEKIWIRERIFDEVGKAVEAGMELDNVGLRIKDRDFVFVEDSEEDDVVAFRKEEYDGIVSSVKEEGRDMIGG